MVLFRTIDELRFPVDGFGGSLIFDGVDDFVTIPGIIPSVSAFSWSTWVKMSPSHPAFGMIFDYNQDNRGTRFLYDSTVLRRFNYEVANGTSISAVTPNNFRLLNGWVNFIGTYNGLSFSLYMNNKFVQSQSKTMIAPTLPQILTLGRRSSEASGFGKFSLAHFAWQNGVVWTEKQRADAYYLGQFPKEASWYNFLDNVDDQSENGNHMEIGEGTSFGDGPHHGPRQMANYRGNVGELRSASLENATNRITLPSSPLFYNNAFTISGYMKPSTVDTNRTLFGWSGNSTPQVAITSGNFLRLNKQNIASIATTTRQVLKDIWQFFAVSFDENGDYKLYLCNSLSKPIPLVAGNSVQTWTYSTSVPYVGNVVGFAQAFRGLLKNVKYFNRALSPEEVIQAKVENDFNSLDDCISLFKLDEASGTTAVDIVNALNGVKTNVGFSSNVPFPPRNQL